jgi:tetratricopeptide (TPR) repeat protein
VIKGYLKLQTGEYAHAIPPLTLALSIDTNNQTARFNRAIAYLRGNQLDEAQKDYEVLEKYFPNSFRIYYGLGEIAWRKSETNRAIHYYELYLSNSVPNSEEARLINERLQSLNPPSP